jgi:hypothetical protein
LLNVLNVIFYAFRAAFILNSSIVAFAVGSGTELRRYIGPIEGSWPGFGTIFAITLGMYAPSPLFYAALPFV